MLGGKQHHKPKKLFQSKCWEKAADDRPSFGDLLRDFEVLLVKECDYIDLNLYPENAYYNDTELSFSNERI